MTGIDWIIVVAYLAAALAVGIVFARRAGKSTSEFFISGRNLPWWLAGTSMVATSFAADTPLLITKWTRTGGIAGNWIWWCWAMTHVFVVVFLARLWRRAEVVTAVEFTEIRYSGKPAAALRGFRSAYMALPVNCIAMAMVIAAIGKFTQVIFDTTHVEAVLICIAIATVYSVLSGFWGVVVTDLIQFVIAMGGAIALAVVAVRHVGGLEALRDALVTTTGTGGKHLAFFPSPPEAWDLLSVTFWKTPFVAFLVFLSVQWWANKNADGGGLIIQRMCSAKDEKQSMLATLWFSIAHYALRPWPWILVALVSLVLLPGLADHESAYPLMVKRLAPPGLMGLLLASFLAAFMSTIDSQVNLGSSYVVNDFYRRFLVTNASERHYVAVSRVASVLFIAAAAVIAFAASSIFALLAFLLTFSSGVGIVYILRWFWWRINAWSEISAMIASSVIALALTAFDESSGLTFATKLFITVAGSTVVALTATFFTRPTSKETLTAFYRKVRPYGTWGDIPREADVPRAMGLGWLVFVWISGTVMVLSATFAIGKFLLCEPTAGVVYLTVALVGAVVVFIEVFREHPRPAKPQDVV